MRSECKDGVLTLYLEGRVDTTNAPQTEAEIEAARAGASYTAVVIDADGLEYISSAGLRVVLRLRKAEPSLRVINASSEVYEIFEMTGFSEMIPVEKAYRKLSVEGCKVIGQGAKGTVYRWNEDTIVKVYKNPDSLPDIQRERDLARRAFVLGIPTAISYDVVRVGESFGSVFELLNAKPFSELIAADPEGRAPYVRTAAEMLRQIHSTEVRPEDMPDNKKLVQRWCADVAEHLPADQHARLVALVDAVPDVMHMVHGDYHTNNIMMQGEEALLIDMDTLSHGHPVFELANVYVTYVAFGEADPTVVEKFLGMPYDVAVKFWQEFLPAYLGTDDSARIAAVEQKAQLLGYVRLLRHTVRRGVETDAARRKVEIAKQKIADLLPQVDTLDF